MKNLFLFYLVLFVSNSLLGQEEVVDHSYIIGGSANISFQDNYYPLSLASTNSNLIGVYSNTNDESNTFNFDLSPYLLKKVTSHWFLGLSINYGFYQRKIDDFRQFGQTTTYAYKQANHRFGGRFFSRYLLNPLNSLQFYLQPGIGYGFHKNTQFADDEVNQTEYVNYLNIGGGFGLLYQINSKFQATLNIGNLSFVNGFWKFDKNGSKNWFSAINSNFNLSSISFGFEMKL